MQSPGQGAPVVGAFSLGQSRAEAEGEGGGWGYPELKGRKQLGCFRNHGNVLHNVTPLTGLFFLGQEKNVS